MKNDRKYKVRRLVAAIFLLFILTLFTSVVITKGVENNNKYQERILQEHKTVWERE